MRIVFMGTPDFAVPSLEKLCEADLTDVVGVITQPDRKRGRGQNLQAPPVKEVALDYDIEVYQPQKVTSEEGLDKLEEWAPDLIVVVAYGQILGKEVLDLPDLGCVNVHASLLPKYRGAAPLHRALIEGEDVTGVTTMQMDEGMDTGDIILQEEVEIIPQDTVGSLHDKLATTGANLLLETLEQIEAGTAPRIPQNSDQATYAAKVSKEDGEVDWEQSARDIWNLVRGMNPWPGAYTYKDEELLKLWDSEIYDETASSDFTPGTVVKTDDEQGIIVQTGEGQLLITQLQPANKSRMSATDYLLGYELEAGVKLGEK
ncbi:methionyl-tRNA formyltransferase [Halanaerobacter jeridensis]|uniref:Methionyl-tRNA formyltransferase n=1 Tax=Halanaerobacter jeridensis TaxID=706427 RepID=A0A938XNA3_9FIRM|nr:methionyl-tRNA formyltransferase [Halanaerobacter jeridensis]MBM7555508.1 methionyl-tRNA formyltransferase [Halanaerobacter jeridensis]